MIVLTFGILLVTLSVVILILAGLDVLEPEIFIFIALLVLLVSVFFVDSGIKIVYG